ncbi:MAG: type I methionyl aminopeptidase, partial [Myxococcota bacterium]|nr:type I methionyl aminopeptidase [Myxococcota bacterium]
MVFRKKNRQVNLKSNRELQSMRAAGHLAAECLEWIINQVEPKMSTQDIDDLQCQFAKKHAVICAPLNYRGFPKSICTSVNEVICHGIPDPKHILKEGDIIGVDVTLIVEGFHGDNASTIPVGQVSESTMHLLRTTLESQRNSVLAVQPGARLGDIGHAIQARAEPEGYSVVRDFVGHGIGRTFHEEPEVRHYGEKGKGLRLRPGMTFTIEPMINEGVPNSIVLDDNWTAITADHKLSAQYEHTLAVTDDG